jgi:hypothetical protein
MSRSNHTYLKRGKTATERTERQMERRTSIMLELKVHSPFNPGCVSPKIILKNTTNF